MAPYPPVASARGAQKGRHDDDPADPSKCLPVPSRLDRVLAHSFSVEMLSVLVRAEPTTVVREPRAVRDDSFPALPYGAVWRKAGLHLQGRTCQARLR